MIQLERTQESSKKSPNETSKTEPQPSTSSDEVGPITETAYLNLALEETGTFRICTPPCYAKQTASVLGRLNERERELWCRRFTSSCVENILNAETVDNQTKAFYREIERKLKEQSWR